MDRGARINHRLTKLKWRRGKYASLLEKTVKTIKILIWRWYNEETNKKE